MLSVVILSVTCSIAVLIVFVLIVVILSVSCFIVMLSVINVSVVVLSVTCFIVMMIVLILSIVVLSITCSVVMLIVLVLSVIILGVPSFYCYAECPCSVYRYSQCLIFIGIILKYKSEYSAWIHTSNISQCQKSDQMPTFKSLSNDEFGKLIIRLIGGGRTPYSQTLVSILSTPLAGFADQENAVKIVLMDSVLFMLYPNLCTISELL
jgi:hypothetical protein